MDGFEGIPPNPSMEESHQICHEEPLAIPPLPPRYVRVRPLPFSGSRFVQSSGRFFYCHHLSCKS